METPESRRVLRTLSVLTIAVGMGLMIVKIYADSEPGGIPLLLILAGALGYRFTRPRQPVDRTR